MIRYAILFFLGVFTIQAGVLWVAAQVVAPNQAGEILHLAKSACALGLLFLAVFCIVAVWIPRRA